MVRVLWIGLMALVWMGATPAAAESRLFTGVEPLNIVITAPFPALVHTARTTTNPYPATLAVTEGAGPAQTLSIQLRARGLTRRTAGFCQFPPLLLEFDKAAVHETVFKGQHKLKLVTYCNKQSDYEQRIVLEYLAYRIYNLITPMSYRVRAAMVTYRNDEHDPGVTRFGYVLEDVDDVADRNHSDVLKAASRQVSPTQMDARAAARAALFEYMIGNLDWEFLAAAPGTDCCHNARLIAARHANPATATGVTPVPYDFDWSGFVDAPYAGPPEGIPVDTITDRYFRGYCAARAELPSVIEEFRAHRAEMMALIDGETHLNSSFRSKAGHFLDGFFAVLDDPDRTDRELTRRCR